MFKERIVSEPWAKCPKCGDMVQLTTIRGKVQLARHRFIKDQPFRADCAGSNTTKFSAKTVQYRDATYGSL